MENRKSGPKGTTMLGDAIRQALADGRDVRSIAREHDVSEGAVRYHRRQVAKAQPAAESPPQRKQRVTDASRKGAK